MAKSSYKPRGLATLKQAEDALVEANGGQVKSADLAGLSKGRIFQYTDDSEANAKHHMPVHVVRILEAACGEPIVTAFLAAEARCALLRLAPLGAPANWVKVTGKVAAEAAAVLGAIAKALKDDQRVDAAEAARILVELDEALAVYAGLRERLARIRDGEDVT